MMYLTLHDTQQSIIIDLNVEAIQVLLHPQPDADPNYGCKIVLQGGVHVNVSETAEEIRQMLGIARSPRNPQVLVPKETP